MCICVCAGLYDYILEGNMVSCYIKILRSRVIFIFLMSTYFSDSLPQMCIVFITTRAINFISNF